MSPAKIGIGVITALLLLLTGVFMPKIIETNQAGFYQIKQAAVSGEMTVKGTPGMYAQMFGSIHDYKISDVYYFSSSDLDGGDGEESQPIMVRFNDGSVAKIEGNIKFRLSTNLKDQLRLHEDFRSYSFVEHDLIRQTVTEALQQSANLMTAEESYSTRRSELTEVVERQIKEGIFAKTNTEVLKQDVEGNTFIVKKINIKKDKEGNPVVSKRSPFKTYNVEVLQFVIKKILFDKKILALIEAKKDAEQQKVVAKAQAEKAKQDAITAREEGAAKIATAKAEEDKSKLVEVIRAQRAKEIAEIEAAQRVSVEKLAKQTETVKAQKEFDVAKISAEKELQVAKLERQAAEQNAAAKLELGESEAKVAALKVEAGLSPLERAQIDMQTSIGVAREIAKAKFPTTMITSGSGKNGSGMSPIEIVGLNQMMDLAERTGRTGTPKLKRTKSKK